MKMKKNKNKNEILYKKNDRKKIKIRNEWKMKWKLMIKKTKLVNKNKRR